jgi:plasmid stabilization system protein ParE
MASLVFHPQARTDYRQALSWYSRESRRAATRFQREMDRVLQVIESTPDRYPFFEGIIREAPLNRYPYSLIYQVGDSGEILILAVAHASREPGYWSNRT